MLGDRAVGDLGDETQGAFRPDHQVLEDVERVLEIDQGVEAVAGCVLDAELAPDALRQLDVFANAHG